VAARVEVVCVGVGVGVDVVLWPNPAVALLKLLWPCSTGAFSGMIGLPGFAFKAMIMEAWRSQTLLKKK
jgi:hypothetical protein